MAKFHTPIRLNWRIFPKLHEVIQIGRYQFKIIKVTATKIELVRLKVLE